jgi:multisubunit Na+/H+ antiporter MnhF subunit
VNIYLWCASALLLGLVPCGIVIVRAPAIDALVALELAGVVVTLALVCLAAGFHRSGYFNVAAVCAAMIWVGSLVFVRFLAHEP